MEGIKLEGFIIKDEKKRAQIKWDPIRRNKSPFLIGILERLGKYYRKGKYNSRIIGEKYNKENSLIIGEKYNKENSRMDRIEEYNNNIRRVGE
jgi:hypothetical protein